MKIEPAFMLIRVFVILLLCADIWASKTAPELNILIKSLSPDTEIPVIITMREKLQYSRFKNLDRQKHRTGFINALRTKSESSQQAVRKLLKQKGVKSIEELWIINSIAIKANSRLISELAGRDDIESIKFDYKLSLPQMQYAQAEQAEWNIQMINAEVLWGLGFTGQGAVVASMDSGVDLAHADLYPRWRGGTNSWYDPHNEHSQPYDASGHGTGVMGIMVGGNSTGSAIGVAPDANWIAVKIFNDTGNSSFSKIHLGFQWLLDPDGDPNTDDAPDIVNNSWGLRDNINECIAEFYYDIEILRTAGIAVVFSAGNEGPQYHTSISPGNYDNCITVGAVGASGIISDFSSRGPSACYGNVFPHLAAPGQNIKTSDLTGGGAFPTEYAYVSGTSFAAPHVSGTIALLLSAFPDLNVAQFEEVLLSSAADLGLSGPDNDYGYGLINAAGAYQSAYRLFMGDFDLNCNVNLSDLAILAGEWLNADCFDCRTDMNGDKSIDFLDFAVFAKHFGSVLCP